MKCTWKQLVTAAVVSCLMLSIGFVAVGCGTKNNQSESSGITETAKAPTYSGVIREAGSTSVLPLAEKFALAFMEKHPNLEVTYTGGGSGAGVKQCAAGTVDIGAASREVKMTEKDLISYPIARDGVAVVVNEGNPVSDLSLEQIAKIYAGEITNWSEIGGSDLKITVYGREEGSGTRDCFDHKVLKSFGLKITVNALSKKSNGEVQIGIQDDVSGIGYVSLGYVSGLKALSIGGDVCSFETCKDGSYPIVRRLYFITREAPDDAVRAFINFCRSNAGQTIVENNGYVPLVK